MTRGFYIIMAAQFFSALADNALLIAAIALLRDLHLGNEYAPLLKFFFTISYVALAAFVGAFADSMPKGRVMFISNAIKIVGCGYLLVGSHPLLAYAVVGLGAAAYSPAKYGILTELLPPNKLVLANAWIEGLTVGAIILGTFFGAGLINPHVSQNLLSFDFPYIDTGIDTPAEAAILGIGFFYIVAAIFNLYVPDTGVDHKPFKRNPWFLARDFGHCVRVLWKDKLGQISLAVTTLFWGAGSTLQFIVADWAQISLKLRLDQAWQLQGPVAIGVAVGAVVAAFMVPIHKSLRVLAVGVAMGLAVLTMLVVPSVTIAVILMVIVGALGGFFVVPMNALLQHRGHILVGAGHSIAVQNFNENASILVLVGLYYLLSWANAPLDLSIILFGLFLSGTMALVIRWHRCSMAKHGPEIERLLEVARSSTHH